MKSSSSGNFFVVAYGREDVTVLPVPQRVNCRYFLLVNAGRISK